MPQFRRKDLKQAVHRLRNQLQTRKTKKATTISVLKASEQEIKVIKVHTVRQTFKCSTHSFIEYTVMGQLLLLLFTHHACKCHAQK